MRERQSEVEATLRLAAGSGRELAEELAGLEEVAGYRLRRRRTRELEDLYFDTPEADLGRAGLALRLRRADGFWRIAVKGDARRLPGGGTRRLEVERRWSPAALGEVAELLDARGVEPPDGSWPDPARTAPGPGRSGGPEVGGDDDPAERLAALGFERIQRRSTRRAGGVLQAPSADRRAGELAVDRVAYLVRAGGVPRVVHREVEVEGGGADPEGAVGRVASELLRRYGERLLRWTHDKLATGRAIERLGELGELDGLSGPRGELTERGYARVDDLLAGTGG